ncbi:DUF3866 family protein [Halalkalibacter okhensis]|uniref:DUF3866 domain-containing protein n=1 Tax=Halalkalibacter okhensis TaxID=333138 RepID=A0A0B0IKC2_9BACI|nr:DUF3866 family protein [Halalkalibacter okhensis]KHF41750.1 hypothetical protein LQ50_00125 [Halalkalibacter okhensis]
MYKELKAKVLDICFEDQSIQKLITDNGSKKAILYKSFTARAEVGSQILINTTATDLRLGTGGWDIVRSHLNNEQWHSNDGKGHIMKARYTPIQHSVAAVEAQESDFHPFFKKPFTLEGSPVWLAELHSMVPLFYYASQRMTPGVKCCVVFDDQASLPLMMSDQLRHLKEQEHFYSISVGQAFGAQYEAITVASALQFAKQVLKAEIILISVGPGVVGTGTRYGFTGMALSHWSHTVSALNGTPIWIPRLSFADERSRHSGISHHTLTPLCEFTFKPAILPLPYLNTYERQKVCEQLESYQPFQTNHHVYHAKEDLVSLLVEQVVNHSTLPILTMGRKYEDDPVFFCAVAEALRVGLELEE